MASERKTEPKLTEAAARTAGVLQTLQSRLKREAPPLPREGLDELGNELQEYFAAAATAPSPAAKVPAPHTPNDVRELVIQGAVDQILRCWQDPNSGFLALRQEIIGRLVERVLAELSEKNPAPKSAR